VWYILQEEFDMYESVIELEKGQDDPQIIHFEENENQPLQQKLLLKPISFHTLIGMVYNIIYLLLYFLIIFVYPANRNGFKKSKI